MQTGLRDSHIKRLKGRPEGETETGPQDTACSSLTSGKGKEWDERWPEILPEGSVLNTAEPSIQGRDLRAETLGQKPNLEECKPTLLSLLGRKQRCRSKLPSPTLPELTYPILSQCSNECQVKEQIIYSLKSGETIPEWQIHKAANSGDREGTVGARQQQIDNTFNWSYKYNNRHSQQNPMPTLPWNQPKSPE